MTAGAYAVLGVSPESEDVVIRAAYRALMQKYTSLARLHEDVWADDRRAREVQAAYDAIEAARRETAPPEPAPAPAPAVLAPARSQPVHVAIPEPAPIEPALAHAPARRSAAPALAAVAAVIAAGGAAAWWVAQPRPGNASDQAAPPALRVSVRPAAAAPLARPLSCFVNGHAVGQLRLADCAARNGVASGPLEVGIAAPPPPFPAAVAGATLPSEPGPTLPRHAPASVLRPLLAASDAKVIHPLQAPMRAAKPAPGPAHPTAGSKPSAAPQPRDGPDHLDRLLAMLTPLAKTLVAKAQEAVVTSPPPVESPRPAEPRPTSPRPAPADIEVPIAGPAAPPTTRPQDAPPVRLDASGSVAVVRDFYRALALRDAQQASALVAPDQRDAGPLSTDRLRRFSASVRQPLRVTGIRAVGDDAVAVRYQYVSAGNRLCEGVADVATTQHDDRVMIRGIRSSYAC